VESGVSSSVNTTLVTNRLESLQNPAIVEVWNAHARGMNSANATFADCALTSSDSNVVSFAGDGVKN
jgi:hypothetical protein